MNLNVCVRVSNDSLRTWFKYEIPAELRNVPLLSDMQRMLDRTVLPQKYQSECRINRSYAHPDTAQRVPDHSLPSKIALLFLTLGGCVQILGQVEVVKEGSSGVGVYCAIIASRLYRQVRMKASGSSLGCTVVLRDLRL